MPEIMQKESQNLENQQKPNEDKKKLTPKIIFIALFCAVLVVLAGLYWWLTRNDISTDDAFTAGRAINIAPHVSGYVTDLCVNDNQFVHKGDVLLRIDSRDYDAAYLQAVGDLEKARGQYASAQYLFEVAKKNYPGNLKVAQGELEIAKANAFKAKTEFDRQHRISRPATTQQAIDYATAAYNQAKAEIAKAEGNLMIAQPVQANIGNSGSQIRQQEGIMNAALAKVKQAQLNVEWTTLTAPHDGWIAKRNVEQGNFVTTGQSLIAIVEPETWVIANYKETQITHMRPGQKVKISVDAYPFLNLEGHIDSLQAATGAVFSAFPPENATGNYVKIVQRVPVKIVIDKGLDPNLPLALGLSVVPTVYTK